MGNASRAPAQIRRQYVFVCDRNNVSIKKVNKHAGDGDKGITMRYRWRSPENEQILNCHRRYALLDSISNVNPPTPAMNSGGTASRSPGISRYRQISDENDGNAVIIFRFIGGYCNLVKIHRQTTYCIKCSISSADSQILSRSSANGYGCARFMLHHSRRAISAGKLNDCALRIRVRTDAPSLMARFPSHCATRK